MLETVRAFQFDGAVASGKSLPSRVTCEKADGSTVEVVAKFSQGCDRKLAGLAIEVIAACLGTDLGLPIPWPYLIEVDSQWIDTVPDINRRSLMRASSPIAFGSSHLPPGFRSWSSGDRVTDAIASTALAIFVFDAMINNPDRRSTNPNCLVRGTELRIFDHELAFIYKGIRGWKEPWKLGALASLATPGQHIFYNGLTGRSLDLDPIRAAWSSLGDARLRDYAASIPPAWSGAKPAVDEAIDLIRAVRDNIAGCLTEVQRVLT